MGKLSGMASDDGLMGLELISLCCDLIENGDNKYCGFAHSWLGLAKNVVALQG